MSKTLLTLPELAWRQGNLFPEENNSELLSPSREAWLSSVLPYPLQLADRRRSFSECDSATLCIST